MRNSFRLSLATLLFTCLAVPALAQQKLTTPPAPANKAAATVNGQVIPEAVIQRSLSRVPPQQRDEARKEIVNYLIENMLIDQYLQQNRITSTKEEVDKRLEEMQTELKKQKLDFTKVLLDMQMTLAELRDHIGADLRWEKYVTAQSTDQKLQQIFASNKEIFDGTMMRVRHILVTPTSQDAKAKQTAKDQVAALKKQIETQVAAEMAKVPPDQDKLAREKSRIQAIDKAFGDAAKAKSSCPSKAQGGDVGWFDRAGTMVEPFSRVAFGLKAFEMSDVVETEFGYHLILATDRRPGKDVKFEQLKNEVKGYYADRLRDTLVQHLRPRATIVVH